METGESKLKSIMKEVLSTSIYLLLVLCAAYLIVTYVGQRTQVSGGSMESTLSNEDHLLVDKISYRFHETVRIDEEGNIYIDEELLEEDYGREVIENPGRAVEPITLGDDEYFVMGDNRNNSSDSRDPSVGNIHRDDIIGRAFIRIWPLSKFGILKHQ